MVETVINDKGTSGACTLWTPWGPQSTGAASPKLTALRRRLQKLGAKKDTRRQDKLHSAYTTKPECAYDP